MRARSIVAIGAVLLATLLVAGYVVAIAPAGDAESPPSDTALDFEEVNESVGFEYASIEGGAGNGNDGLYVGDYDGDLREDLLAIGGAEPVLFENTGEGFEPSGALPNVSSTTEGRIQSALWLDHDNDGSEDLLLLPRDDTPIFLENDGGRFAVRDVGLDDEFVNPVGAATADYDGDGCLDLFVTQYGRWDDTTPAAWNDDQWTEDNGHPNALYRGSCGDGFERTHSAGVAPGDRGPHWSLTTSFVDLNDDDRPDIHVANDYFNDTVYYNQGDGTFERVRLGSHTDRNGMSSEVADIRGDDRPELFVTNIFFPRDRIDELDRLHRQLFNNFLRNRLGKRLEGNNLLVANGSRYDDVASEVGLAEGGWGWAAALADLDSDGELDAFHSTQTVVTFDEEDPLYELPMAWVQQDGEFYRQDADEIGLVATDGRAVTRIDYDRDGALDLAVAAYDGPYRFYENNASQGNSLQVVVDGTAEQTAVGAEIYATADGETHHRFANDRVDFQSQESRVLHVGVGDAEAVEELRVVWPDGTERSFEDVAVGQRVRITPDGIQDRLAYDD